MDSPSSKLDGATDDQGNNHLGSWKIREISHKTDQTAETEQATTSTPGEEMEDPATATPMVQYASCDGCNKAMFWTRHHCQDCPDFDYCDNCVQRASTIHPTHTFTKIHIKTSPETAKLEQQFDKIRIEMKAELDAAKDNPFKLDPVSFFPSDPAQCRCCFVMLTRILPLTPWIRKESREQKRVSLYWPLRLSTLIEATQSGCSFCSLVLVRLFGVGDFTSQVMMYKPRPSWTSSFVNNNDERAKVISSVMKLLARIRNQPISVAIVPEYGLSEHDLKSLEIGLVDDSASPDEAKREQYEVLHKYGARGRRSFRLDAFAVAGTPAAEYLTTRPPNPTPGSASSMQQLANWATTCEQNHPQCRSSSSSTPLPSRVLDVSGKGREIRLYETADDETGRYCALSYCWGGPQTNQTTKANIQDRLPGFNLEKLPQTIQDAVRVARELNIDYLWIDSMCMIQDDEADKQAEIDRMGSIYENSVITLCAAREWSVEGGFLEDWADQDTGLWPGLVPLPYTLHGKSASSIEEATRQPSESGTIWLIEEEPARQIITGPLASRGWCLQERLLSPRIIDYGRWPIWRCLEGSQGDYGAANGDRKFEPEEVQYTELLLTTSRDTIDMFRANQLHQGWYKTVEDYTRRKLGEDRDRLPAIGGIAARMSSLTGAKYVAGLWENNFLHDLMWTSEPGEWSRRAQPWRAPTWSWASVESPISYSSITEDSKALAQVLRCEIQPGAASSSSFSQVSSGSISIRGPFVELDRDVVLSILSNQSMAPSPPSSGDFNEWMRALLEHTRMSSDSEYDPETLPDKPIYVLVTFERGWYVKFEDKIEKRCWSGLLLCETENGQYERIGAFTNESVGPWARERPSWGQKTITIV